MLKLQSPTRPKSLDELLDSALVARLSALDISTKKILAGKMKGERRSKRRGQSVEFADHRQYVTGDDLRHIDWNIFGRLERLFIKLFLEEEDLSLHIVLDASASLDCGTPSKFLLLQRLALAMGYIGLTNLHRVTISTIGGLNAEAQPQLLSAIRDLRGRRRLQDMARFILSLEPGGPGNFTEACKRIALTRRGKGITLVLSDFLVKEGYETGLRLLLGRGFDVYAVPVLSPQEVKPDLGGDLRLKDCEDSDLTDLTITAPLLKRYHQTLTAYFARLRDFCARRSIVLLLDPAGLPITSDTPVDALVLDYLRRKGLVR